MMEVWIGMVLLMYMLATCHGCGITRDYTVMDNSAGLHIKSDGFPSSPYMKNADECWTIWKTANGTLGITFRDFDTEFYFDVVVVYDDSYANEQRKLVWLSGRIDNSNQVVHSTNGSYLHVTFTTDGSNEMHGWQACICGGSVSCNCVWDTPREYNASISDTDLVNLLTGLSQTVIIIIGCVVGGVILLCVVVGVAVGCYMSNRSRNRRTTAANVRGVNNAGMITAPPPGTYPVQQGFGYVHYAQEGVTVGGPGGHQPQYGEVPGPYPMHQMAAQTAPQSNVDNIKQQMKTEPTYQTTYSTPM